MARKQPFRGSAVSASAAALCCCFALVACEFHSSYVRYTQHGSSPFTALYFILQSQSPTPSFAR
eukprot:55936-Eustigmatos_ZCMA.PRE.1